jgi:membrane-associated phospholipid phosphatase
MRRPTIGLAACVAVLALLAGRSGLAADATTPAGPGAQPGGVASAEPSPATPAAATVSPAAAGAAPAPVDATEPAAAAQPRRRIQWNERWHKFRPIEYVTTAATAVGDVLVFFVAKAADHPKWVGPILFDTPVRDALRLRTRSGIQAALDASYYAALITPLQTVIDSIVVPAADANLEVAWQLALMDAQAFALSGLVTASLYDVTGRARPSYAECKAGTSVDPLCNAGAYASFPSGHTSAAMTGAGLLCAHHGALPLYGGAWDAAACVESLTVATTVGVLRMMADRHYASDVLTGGAIGFVSGYGLPMLLHYWKKPLGEVMNRDGVKVAITPGAGETPFGAQVLGMF